MSAMNATDKAILVAFALVATTYATVIHLENRKGLAAVCKGTVAATLCTTTTSDGFLLWRNATNSSFTFFNTASVNDTGTLGSMTMVLDSKDPVGNTFVYTSTASDIIMEETNFTCSDGEDSERIDISANSPSSPSWAYSACRFSHGSVQLSWNPPVVAPECCQQYSVQLSTNESFFSDTLSINVPMGAQPVNATVYCIDHLGDNTTSQVMTIDSSTALGITIKVLYGSCDTNTTYNISWTTNEGVCTPPITMSTITCTIIGKSRSRAIQKFGGIPTTSSTYQSSNNTRSMICSAPSNETINAIVTITNEAGVTTTKSNSADAIAQICQKLSCDIPSPTGEPVPGQLPQTTITAIIVASVIVLLLVLLLFVMIVILIYTCILKRNEKRYLINAN